MKSPASELDSSVEAESNIAEAPPLANRAEAGLSVRLIYLAIGAIAITGIFARLQFTTDAICCGDFDSYYHIRWSQLLWQGIKAGSFPPTFTWLPLTTLEPAGYVDHHLLFHIIQIPFTWFGDLRLGAKIAAVVFASLALFSCYWLVIRYRISYALFWLVALLACSAPFLYRLSMAKAPPLAIIFMVVGIYLLFEKKYVWLAPLAFLFVWTYSLFVTLLAAALIWPCIVAWSERRFEWRPLAWTIFGTCAGFILNPYFPKNVRLFIEHARMKVTPLEFTTSVGTEWYPYESWYFLGSCLIAFAAMLAGYIAFDWSDRKRAERPLFFLIFSTLLMIASFRSRRFVEYWPPFAILFAAFSLQPILDGVRGAIAARLPSDVMDELEPFLDRHELPEVKGEQERARWGELELSSIGILLGIVLCYIVYQYPKLFSTDKLTNLTTMNWRVMVVVMLSIVIYLAGCALYIMWRKSSKSLAVIFISMLCLVAFVNARETSRAIAGDSGPAYYEKGMAWMRANVPPGQVIFNTDWDDFPKMFFYDTTHAYVSGLDPTYLLDKNPDLAKLYEDITLGREKDPGPIIRDRFGARYVFSDNAEVHDNFFYNALQSGWFEKVYEDEECTVLYIRDEKGVPPPEASEEATETDQTDGSEEDTQQQQ